MIGNRKHVAAICCSIVVGLLVLGYTSGDTDLQSNGAESEAQDESWEPLFDGKTLMGWHRMGGRAEFFVRDETIVGRTVPDTPNSFLVTDQNYGDFVLELEVKVDSSLNSGIQIRSNSYTDYRDGVVHGYQVEIDPSPRAWSAGIYEEQGRGWLFDLEGYPEAQAAFRQNDWNHYRIEAIGSSLKTWLNRVAAAVLVDDRTSSGFIGLQVHSVGSDESKTGIEVAWRNIRIKDLGNPTLSGSLNSVEHPIAAASDGNPDSYWLDLDQGAWLEWDLRAVKALRRINLRFLDPANRTYEFDLLSSLDRITWSRMIPRSRSSGDSLEVFEMSGREVRFVRYVGFCNDQNCENAVAEFEVTTE
jgi:hypothetical protein